MLLVGAWFDPGERSLHVWKAKLLYWGPGERRGTEEYVSRHRCKKLALTFPYLFTIITLLIPPSLTLFSVLQETSRDMLWPIFNQAHMGNWYDQLD